MKLIKLGGKKGKGKFAQVDDEDYEELNQYTWWVKTVGTTIYAERFEKLPNKKRKLLMMHRQLLNLKERFEIGDHIDHDGLNNQKNNLRKASVSENAKNRTSMKGSSSSYLGVSIRFNKVKYYSKKEDTYTTYIFGPFWRAAIKVFGKPVELGQFKNEIDAAKAYNEAAIKHHGEFANPNIII